MSMRRTAFASLLTMCALLLTSCGEGGAPKGVTEESKSFTSAWNIFLFGAVVVAALIWLLVITAVLRFRRRDAEGVPTQKQYNIPLEIAYTAAPLVLVAALFGLTLVKQSDFTSTTNDPDVTVEVVGFQWQWQFRYPDGNVTMTGSEADVAELVVPVGETIQFDLVSNDVNHSFWVPEFLEKRDLIQGVDNQIQVTVTQPGEWTGHCAEYCGLEHYRMTFKVRALPKDQFDEWLRQAKAAPQPIIGHLEGAP